MFHLVCFENLILIQILSSLTCQCILTFHCIWFFEYHSISKFTIQESTLHHIMLTDSVYCCHRFVQSVNMLLQQITSRSANMTICILDPTGVCGGHHYRLRSNKSSWEGNQWGWSVDLEIDELQQYQSLGCAHHRAGGLWGGVEWISGEDESIPINTTRGWIGNQWE